MYIAITGNIGSGKTTLAGLLSKHYGWDVHYDEADNPYLYDFYEDMERWSFNLQISFLNQRLRKILYVSSCEKMQILDRTIYEDVIFAANLNSLGLMASRDYQTYYSLYSSTIELLPPPTILIYLKASVPTLVSQIQKRGRKYEAGIRLDYLNSLNERYNKWISEYEGRHIIIDVDLNNFSETSRDLSIIIDKINAYQFGLF